MIAQALAEYSTLQALVDGVRTIGVHLEEVAREWGLTGLGVAVGAAILWKFFTRVK